MIPLIKLVHPDFFAQEGATVSDTNESSLQKLNEVLDICQHKLIYGSETTKASRMRLKLAERYTLVFYQYELEPDAAAAAAALEPDKAPPPPPPDAPRELSRFTCDLVFPRELVAKATDRVFRAHVEGQLERLLVAGGLSADAGAAAERAADAAAERVRQRAAAGAYVRRSAEELRELRAAQARATQRSLEYICTFTSGRAPATAAAATGATVGGRRRGAPPAPARVRGAFGGGAGALGGGGIFEARARRANDFLRSGRVLFRGVALAAQARALRRLHALLVDAYEALRLDDDALWASTAVVLTSPMAEVAAAAQAGGGGGAARGYSVREADSGSGHILLAPVNFDAGEMRAFMVDALGARLRAMAASDAVREATSAAKASRLKWE
ncbi:hypothetical protein JKP88DRAFT_350937 [Tribonema minus]|uniref:DUF4460 domain-containing protein n=1 Tax=Tribonema minus TaxID=303371 RepID=A0A835YNW8_9STRA|nr:hypothetical protein JKP88DRAFT_350937 [Tribonema minus]